MAAKPLRIGIVAGEASGDVLAAGLIRQIKQFHPDAIIEGIGGEQMIAAGCHSLFDIEVLSVMGLVEVLSSLPRILAVKKGLLAHFTANPPDVFIGVDAPDFNLRIETALKQQGIKTVHYVSPTVWAWREKRIHKIARATNLVLGIFPFEATVYEKYQVPYRFVGHTMADTIPLQVDQAAARANCGLELAGEVIAVLPGSRSGELKRLLPIFLATMEQLLAQKPALKFVIPAANQHRFNQIEQQLRLGSEQLQAATVLQHGNARDAMISADVVLLASGTATLECMLCKRPMVACYQMSALTYRMMQRLYKAPYFALPNILANRQIVPELLQQDVNPQRLCQEVLSLLVQGSDELQETFVALHETLRQGADKQAAQAILELIND